MFSLRFVLTASCAHVPQPRVPWGGGGMVVLVLLACSLLWRHQARNHFSARFRAAPPSAFGANEGLRLIEGFLRPTLAARVPGLNPGHNPPPPPPPLARTTPMSKQQEEVLFPHLLDQASGQADAQNGTRHGHSGSLQHWSAAEARGGKEPVCAGHHQGRDTDRGQARARSHRTREVTPAPAQATDGPARRRPKPLATVLPSRHVHKGGRHREVARRPSPVLPLS